MACCGSSSGCKCSVAAAADDGCSPVTISVAGSGSTASPFTLAPTFDITRLVSLDGDEPWKLATVGSCTMLVPRCQYSAV